MGVSGSGKSTVGKLLSTKTGALFFDGDDFHPKENIRKMASGTPLNDEDRRGWLGDTARAYSTITISLSSSPAQHSSKATETF